MSKKKLVVLISGNGSNLQSLLDTSQQLGVHYEIAAVFSNNKEAYGLKRAQTSKVPAITLDHRKFSSREKYDTALAKAIDNYTPDLIALAGFMRIFTPGFVNHYLGRMLNIHPSLLPKYTGLNTHAKVLKAGDKQHGCSVHFVTEDLDAGPVIFQGKLDVNSDDNANSLAARVQKIEHRIYPVAVDWFARGRLKFRDGLAWLDGELLNVPTQL